jgi:capsular polysaccharide biosynthesis protein
MELRRYLSIIRRRLPLIILIMVAVLAAGWLITPRESTYTSTTTLYVGSRSLDTDPRAVSGDRVAGFDRLIKTFTSMLTSESIARDAISRANVNRSATSVEANISAVQVENTNLIRVSVTDNDRSAARDLANGVAGAFEEELNEFEPRDAQSQIVSVFQRAGLPGTPDPTNLLRNLGLAFIVGLVLAGGTVALLEHLDITLRSSEDVERRLELPVLGVIPALGKQLPVTAASRVDRFPPVARPSREQGEPVA